MTLEPIRIGGGEVDPAVKAVRTAYEGVRISLCGILKAAVPVLLRPPASLPKPFKFARQELIRLWSTRP